MSITKEKKAELVKEFGKSDKDTGSVSVQVAILTHRILELNEHLKANNEKDNQCRKGLLALVTQRKKLMAYLQRTDLEHYQLLVQKLGLRK